MGAIEPTNVALPAAEMAFSVEPSFDEFFDGEQERLIRIMWMVTRDLQEAEDIVQEAFLKVWDRWVEVSSMESPVGYLHRVAMNVFRNRFRRTKTALRKTVIRSVEDDAFSAAEDRVSIDAALARLTERQRAALVLTELLGYPADEAGRMLGVGSSTVRSLAHAGRNALRGSKELADD
jgi:RNA polymerase sigma-70 factor, ECF subfamily